MTKVEISHRTIVFTVLLLLALWFLYVIRDVLFFVFIAFIIMSALRPIVDWMASKRIPRALAIGMLYIVLFGIVGLSLVGTVPSLVAQSTKLVQQLPSVVSDFVPHLKIDQTELSRQLTPIGENIVRVTVSVFSNVVNIFMVLVLGFYLLIERENLEKTIVSMIGETKGNRTNDVIRKIESRMGHWVLGQLFLMFMIGLMSYIGLVALRVEFALPLAIIAGILEIVPNVGPILSAVPAVLIGLSVSPILALSVAAVYFVVQQAENHIIVPLVMRRSVGLSPLITIFSLLVGARLAGIAGAVLAVPMVLLLEEVLKAVVADRKEE